jgi:hypothetical protein
MFIQDPESEFFSESERFPDPDPHPRVRRDIRFETNMKRKFIGLFCIEANRRIVMRKE